MHAYALSTIYTPPLLPPRLSPGRRRHDEDMTLYCGGNPPPPPYQRNYRGLPRRLLSQHSAKREIFYLHFENTQLRSHGLVNAKTYTVRTARRQM